MNKRTWLGMTAGISLGALAIAGWRLYQRRSIERVPNLEGIEDPAAALAYGRIMRFPHVALLRRYIARRAAGMMSAGTAADLGCGPGYLAIELARNASDLYVTGVDLSDAMLAQAIANARLADVAHQTDFRTGDVAALPFRDASLDLVVSTFSLHHWDDPTPAFDEVARVLRPGGAFMIFDLRRDVGPAPWLLFWFVTRYIVPGALRHIGEPLGSRNAAYTPDEVAGLLQPSRLTGWRVVPGPFWLSIEGDTV